MSTYTDLHNRIKENLTILRKPGSTDDGMSPQKVILVNPENQFYGTFSGQMNVTGGTLSDLALVGGTLNGTTIKDAKFLDGNQVVPIGELAASASDHEQRISDLEVAKDAISAAHDSLSTGLSSVIDSLSTSVTKNIADSIAEVMADIGGAVGDVSKISANLDQLSGKVLELSTNHLNGVVYKGTLLLKQNEYESPFELFKPSTLDRCCLVRRSEAEEVYSNGWMYRIALDHSSGNIPADKLYVKLHDLSGSDVWMLGDGDFIIIKNHDSSKYSIKVGEITLADLDRINAQDQDDVHDALLKQVSSWLDEKVDWLSSKLCVEIQSLSTSLSNEISSLSANLCAEIEFDRQTIKDVSAETLLSSQSYTDGKIENLSATTSALVGVVSSETLVSANAFTKTYADTISTDISSSVDDRLEALSNDLSSYSNKLCSDISSQVDAEYVHKAGDEIEWADVGDLSAGKIEVGKLSAKSIENIELKTSESIILSSASGIEANVGLDKVVLAGTSLQETIQNVSSYLDRQKLDVDLANELSNKICSDVINSGYLKGVSVDLVYDKHDKLIKLIAGDSTYQISADDFIKDGMLEDVRYDALGDDDHENPPYIVLTFNTDAKKEAIWLRVKELVDIYDASEDGIALSGKTFKLKYDDIKEKTGLNALSDDLYGKPGEIGRLQDLQNQISTISSDDFGTLAFTGHLVPIIGTPYESLSALFYPGIDDPLYPGCVKNGGTYNIAFKRDPDPLVNVNEKSVSVDLGAGKTLLLGNGDILIVHDHSKRRFVPLSDLTYAENGAGAGNTYLIKAGVSRYEFEDEAKKRADETNFISSWIISNFVNVEDYSYDSTTTFKQDLSATKDLSVAGSTLLLGELRALDGALNALSTDSGKMISGEAREIALSASDAINFTAPGAEIDIDRTKIAISASSYLGLSADDVEILSVLSVDSEKATATTLSVAVLSSDTLTSRTLDVAEKLSATNAYADWLRVGQEVVKTLSVADSLSIVSFSNLYAEDTLCSVASLCVGLSTQISGLSVQLSNAISSICVDLSTEISDLSTNLCNDIKTLSTNLSGNIDALSTNLSTQISGLTHKLCEKLNVIDNKELSSISDGSSINSIISAVVAVRDALSSMRDMLCTLL